MTILKIKNKNLSRSFYKSYRRITTVTCNRGSYDVEQSKDIQMQGTRMRCWRRLNEWVDDSPSPGGAGSTSQTHSPGISKTFLRCQGSEAKGLHPRSTAPLRGMQPPVGFSHHHPCSFPPLVHDIRIQSEPLHSSPVELLTHFPVAATSYRSLSCGLQWSLALLMKLTFPSQNPGAK